jgi:hypothetical protein
MTPCTNREWVSTTCGSVIVRPWPEADTVAARVGNRTGHTGVYTDGFRRGSHSVSIPISYCFTPTPRRPSCGSPPTAWISPSVIPLSACSTALCSCGATRRAPPGAPGTAAGPGTSFPPVATSNGLPARGSKRRCAIIDTVHGAIQICSQYSAGSLEIPHKFIDASLAAASMDAQSSRVNQN